jgi:hypothetical protein
VAQRVEVREVCVKARVHHAQTNVIALSEPERMFPTLRKRDE